MGDFAEFEGGVAVASVGGGRKILERSLRPLPFVDADGLDDAEGVVVGIGGKGFVEAGFGGIEVAV